ncbi:hypothetical protein SFA35_08570 [Pseudomonas sp. HR96]|uniref:hypothetical protein n=1 Tax=Pseudomonas sp. HR96 TaxID=1027966 RepID=UPI002A749FDA|nr:hypothetical protein [Pseudomonas sp. HR96]WPP01396.1 hypothetical protein SFA35_08570 [Pseudomonas sp. HR96]
MLDHDEFPQFARKSQAVEIDGVGDSGTSSAASGSQILQFVAANGGRSPAPSPQPAESAMRVHIQASVEQSLGQMLEFERFGHNRLLPKAVDLDELKSRLRAMKWRPLQRWQRDVLHLLEAPALAFIDKFKLYSKGRGLPGANLDLINFKLRLLQEGLDENSADYELFRQANLLAEHIGATLDLFPSLMFYANAPSWQGLVQKTRGRLFDEVLPVPAERPPINRPFTQQFNQIVNSALWEERVKREVRGGEVRSKANKLLTGVRLRGKFADEVRGESGGGTELADYIHDVCQVLPGVLEAIKRTSKVLLPSHVDPAPLADSAQGFFARAVDRESDLNKKLDAPADIIPKGLKPQMSGLTLATTAESAFLSVKNTLAKLGSKTVKTAYRGLQLAYVANPASNQAVLAAGLILLDSLQQTMRDVGRTRNAVQPLRDAVALQRELRREAAQPLTPALGERLQSDADGWQLKAQAAEKTLLEELERLTPLAVDSGWQALLSDIRDQLKQAPSAARNTIDRFDEVIKEQVRNLAAIHSEVREQTLRLARLGMAGRADFDLYLRYWTQQLQASKNQLKSDLVKATGHSAANFSRHGMLSRGWAEAAEADKQRYLQQLPEADRAEAGVLYQRLLLEALEDHLPLFAKETDPNGKRLLHRLRTELGHAERGTTVYPATMAEILAGVKSTSQEISLWSRKRLATGLLLGIAMGTFSLASLGWKVTARVVLTGHKLVSAARTASQGVRVGQGKASDELREYAKHSVKTAAVKLVVSMTPGLSSALGVATVVWDAYEGGLEGAVDKILLDIAEGLPMMPVHEARGFVTDTASDWAIRLKDHLQQMLHEAPREEAASTDAAIDEPAVAAKLSTSLSTHDELSRIAQSHDPARSALARRLQAQLGDAEVPMSRSNQGGTSLYSPTHHQIELAADADDWVMLHEIAHSLTANKLRFGLRNPDSELGKTAASIEALRQTALAAYQGSDTDTRYYLSTAEEFVAGLYSGKADFIEHLKSIDTGGDSVLSLLVDAICWLLGIAAQQQSALFKALGWADELVGTELPEDGQFDAIEPGEDLRSSPQGDTAPGWKKIGTLYPSERPIPAGQHVQLRFGYENGGNWVVVIEIPDGKRGWPAWLDYLTHYLNTVTPSRPKPWTNPVRVGELKGGEIETASSSSAHDVFVVGHSTAIWVNYSFVDAPDARRGVNFARAATLPPQAPPAAIPQPQTESITEDGGALPPAAIPQPQTESITEDGGALPPAAIPQPQTESITEDGGALPPAAIPQPQTESITEGGGALPPAAIPQPQTESITADGGELLPAAEDDDDDAIPAGASALDRLPGIRPIGAMDNSDMDFPPGKKLYLNFRKRSGQRFSIVIDIPQDARNDGEWQRYAAEYINDRELHHGAIKIGREVGKGYVVLADLGAPNTIYAGSDSDIEHATWGIDSRVQVPGTDLDFPMLDRYVRESNSIAEWVAERQRLEVSKAAALAQVADDDQKQYVAAINLRLQAIAYRIETANAMRSELRGPAQAENDLIEGLSAEPPPQVSTGSPNIDAVAKAKSERSSVSKKLLAIRAYQNYLDNHSVLYSGAEHDARRAKLNTLYTTLAQQAANIDVSLVALYGPAETEKANIDIRARNKSRLQMGRQDAIYLLDLKTELHVIQLRLKDAWDWDHRHKVKLNAWQTAPVMPTGRFTAADFRLPQSEGRALLKMRDAVEAEIKAQETKIVQFAIDNPQEPERAVTGGIAPAESKPAGGNHEREYEQGVAAIIGRRDQVIVQGAWAKSIYIYEADLDKKFEVSYNAKAGLVGKDPLGRIARMRIFTLREILLGEADRYVSATTTIRDIVPVADSSEPITEDLSDALIKLLIRRNRLDVASDFSHQMEAAVDKLIAQPYLQETFAAQVVGATLRTLKDNHQVIGAGKPIYQDIFKAYLMGYLEPTPVYVHGKAIPGVVAIGQGNFRILLSVQTGKVILFDANEKNVLLTDFLKGHVAALDKNTITDSALSPRKIRGRGNLAIWPNQNINFGSGSEVLHSTLLQASADRLKSNLSGLAYTREEADDDRYRDVKRGIAEASLALLTVATVDVPAGVQFMLALWGTAASSLVNMQVNHEDALNSDRLSDLEKSRKDVRVGKFLMGLKLVVPHFSKINMGSKMDTAVAGLSELLTQGSEFLAIPHYHKSVAPVIPIEKIVEASSATDEEASKPANNV